MHFFLVKTDVLFPYTKKICYFKLRGVKIRAYFNNTSAVNCRQPVESEPGGTKKVRLAELKFLGATVVN